MTAPISPTLDVVAAQLASLDNTLREKFASLEFNLKKADEDQRGRLEAAFEAHEKLHAAHDVAHQAQHEASTKALLGAESTMRETARLHADAHSREHIMSNDALEKAAKGDDIRFEHLNEAKARSQDERSTFATRQEVGDKFDAVILRLDSLDKSTALMVERMVQVAGNSARIDSLEKENAAERGKDRGVSATWAILVTIAGVALAVGALVARLFGNG